MGCRLCTLIYNPLNLLTPLPRLPDPPSPFTQSRRGNHGINSQVCTTHHLDLESAERRERERQRLTPTSQPLTRVPFPFHVAHQITLKIKIQKPININHIQLLSILLERSLYYTDRRHEKPFLSSPSSSRSSSPSSNLFLLYFKTDRSIFR